MLTTSSQKKSLFLTQKTSRFTISRYISLHSPYQYAFFAFNPVFLSDKIKSLNIAEGIFVISCFGIERYFLRENFFLSMCNLSGNGCLGRAPWHQHSHKRCSVMHSDPTSSSAWKHAPSKQNKRCPGKKVTNSNSPASRESPTIKSSI